MKRQSKEETATKPEPAKPKTVQKKVVKREEYTVEEPEQIREAVPVAPLPRTVVMHPMLEPEGEPEPEEQEDQLYGFLSRLDREIGYRIKIERLPEFHVTGKYGRGVKTVYCGDQPISIDELVADRHLEIIQRLYGPGSYRLTLRDSQSRLVRNWPVTVEAPLNQERPAPTVPGAPMRVAEAVDPLEDLVKRVEAINRINRALNISREPGAVALPEPARTEPERPPIEERMAEKIFDAVLARKAEHPDLMNAFLKKYVGAEEKDSDWASLIKDLLVPVLPVLLQAGMKFLSGPVAVPLAVDGDKGVSTDGSNLSAPQQQGTIVLTPQQLGWQKLLGRIRQGILDGESVDSAASTFDWFIERFPEGQIQATMLMTAPPAEVLKGIQIEIGPASLGWMMEFQQAVQSVDEEPESQNE